MNSVLKQSQKTSREIGNNGEAIAQKHLLLNNYKIIKVNYSSRYGEIDIIAKKDNTIAFVEVKSRKNSLYGSPCEAVTLSKQNKIKKTVLSMISKFPKIDNYDLRFDVIEVLGIKSCVINHIENAFY